MLQRNCSNIELLTDVVAKKDKPKGESDGQHRRAQACPAHRARPQVHGVASNLSAFAHSKQLRQCVDDIKATSNLVRLRPHLKLYIS